MTSVKLLISGYPGFDRIIRVSRAPEVGETAIILDPPGIPNATAGGCANNIAVAAARLGTGAAPVIVLGDDADGLKMASILEAEGVDTRCIHHVPGGKTAGTFLFIAPEGGHQTFYYPGAADDQIQLNIPAQVLEDLEYGVVTVGNPYHTAQFADVMNKAGIPLVWSLRNDPHAFPHEIVEKLVDGCRILVMNEYEGLALVKMFGLNSLEGLFEKGVEMMILTRGSQGSNVYQPGSNTELPAVSPRAVVDPTGAGDAFVAGLLVGLCRGADPVQAAKIGACTASFVLEQWGCQTSLPTWEQMVQRFLAEFGTLPD